MSELKELIKLVKVQEKYLLKIIKLLESSQNEKKLMKTKNDDVKSKRTAKMTTRSLLLILKEEKFFDKPKTLNEIVNKFEEESRSIPATSLTLPLQKMVRNRELGRILKDGKWAYIKR